MISVLDGVDAGDRNQTGIVLLRVLTVTTWCVCSQVSVVRGRVLAADGSPLIGVRISVVTQPLYGFTLTRQLGVYVTCLYTNNCATPRQRAGQASDNIMMC